MIEKMMELQKEFKELYYNGPLVAISDDYIQVDHRYLREHFPVVRKIFHRENWYKLSAMHNGVLFVAWEWTGGGIE